MLAQQELRFKNGINLTSPSADVYLLNEKCDLQLMSNHKHPNHCSGHKSDQACCYKDHKYLSPEHYRK